MIDASRKYGSYLDQAKQKWLLGRAKTRGKGQMNNYLLYIITPKLQIQWRGKEGGGGGARGEAALQGRQFRSQMYFYYTNRGAHIYLDSGSSTPMQIHHCA